MSWTEDEPQEPGAYMLGGAVIERRDIDSTACWAAVGWGGLRSWSAITGGVPVGTPVVRLVPATERGKLASNLSQTKPDAVTYRLPDWLNSLPVTELRETNWVGDDGPICEARCTHPNGGYVWISLDRSALVEVRPPSIDDPVTLPLVIDELDASGNRIRSLYLGVRDDWTVLDVHDHEIGTHKRIRLNVGGLRDLARAAWQRSFVQAGKQSTVDAARQLAERDQADHGTGA